MVPSSYEYVNSVALPLLAVIRAYWLWALLMYLPLRDQLATLTLNVEGIEEAVAVMTVAGVVLVLVDMLFSGQLMSYRR